MKKAWVENGIIRDVCPVGFEPSFLYGEEIGSYYTEDVPDDAEHGWIKDQGGFWVKPPEIEVPEIIFVPQEVTPRQARLILALQPSPNENYPHLLALVEDAFNQLPEPQKTLAKISWEYATAIERSSDLIAQMQGILGLTSEQIDELFRQASKL